MSKKLKPLSLFSSEEIPLEWENEWWGMPEFKQEDKQPAYKITISFNSFDDVKEFSRIINQKITPKTNSLWYPKQEILAPKNFRYTDES
jgi:hypothetical protein